MDFANAGRRLRDSLFPRANLCVGGEGSRPATGSSKVLLAADGRNQSSVDTAKERGGADYQAAAAISRWVVANSVTAYNCSSFARRASPNIDHAPHSIFFTDRDAEVPPTLDAKGTVFVGLGAEMALARHPDFATARQLLRGYFGDDK
ncbi:MAG: hypothetical protein ACAI38_12375 [Myxococcota bacterium]|nr:hypothetical protein [Myxococcota bacterium]